MWGWKTRLRLHLPHFSSVLAHIAAPRAAPLPPRRKSKQDTGPARRHWPFHRPHPGAPALCLLLIQSSPLKLFQPQHAPRTVYLVDGHKQPHASSPRPISDAFSFPSSCHHRTQQPAGSSQFIFTERRAGLLKADWHGCWQGRDSSSPRSCLGGAPCSSPRGLSNRHLGGTWMIPTGTRSTRGRACGSCKQPHELPRSWSQLRAPRSL